MPFTAVSNYSGKAAGFYISGALQSVVSLDYLTMIENIKLQSNIQVMDATVTPVAAATCDFNDAGTLALTEKVLTPANNQINLDLCKATLLSSGWLRNGNDATVNQAVLTGGAGVAPTSATIIADLQATVDAIPAAVIGKDDLYLYINQQNWQMYIQAVSALQGFPYGNMSDDYTKQFNGIKIAVVNGLQNAAIVAATKSNMFFGTDLLSDGLSSSPRIQLLDMANLDGSDNMRMVCRYSAGTQTGVGADIVLCS
jgi:hypothetical protein